MNKNFWNPRLEYLDNNSLLIYHFSKYAGKNLSEMQLFDINTDSFETEPLRVDFNVFCAKKLKNH